MSDNKVNEMLAVLTAILPFADADGIITYEKAAESAQGLVSGSVKRKSDGRAVLVVEIPFIKSRDYILDQVNRAKQYKLELEGDILDVDERIESLMDELKQ